MNKTMILLLPIASLLLSACEGPDIKGLNSMPERTGEMSTKMDTTNEAIRKQKLLLAVEQLNDPNNQKNIFPVPTGLMPAGKVFAETATPEELVEYTYNELKKIEENDPAYGMEEDGSPSPLSPQEKAVSRRDKFATLYALMIIAGFAQDEKVDQIIQHDINGNSRFQETGLEFLALRAFFLREILLKLSLKVDTSASETLETSGKMKEALKYLLKLDKISKLNLKQTIQVKVEHKGGLMSFEEVQDNAGRKATAAIWQVAVDKAQAGAKLFQSTATTTTWDQSEAAAQEQTIEKIQAYADSWKVVLK